MCPGVQKWRPHRDLANWAEPACSTVLLQWDGYAPCPRPAVLASRAANSLRTGSCLHPPIHSIPQYHNSPISAKTAGLQAQRSKFRPKTRGAVEIQQAELHPAATGHAFGPGPNIMKYAMSRRQWLGYGPVDLGEPTLGHGAGKAAMGHERL